MRRTECGTDVEQASIVDENMRREGLGLDTRADGMRRYGVMLTILVALAWVQALAARPGLPGDGEDSHTRVALLADVRSVQPGTRFTAGILLSMDPGWHTYWQNPGESGLATTVRWTLPSGFSAGGIEWPLPEKKIESGDILTYGYTGEVMLLVSVMPPESLRAGTTVTLGVDVEWLECETTCIPGSASAQMKLPVSSAPPVPDNRQLFEAARRLLPVPLSEESEFTMVETADAGLVDLRLRPTGSARFMVGGSDAPDFFPEASDGLSIGRAEVNAQQTDVRLRIPVRAMSVSPGKKELSGIIVYRMENAGRKAVRIEIPLPSSFFQTKEGTSQVPGRLLDRTFSISESSSGQDSLIVYLLFAVIGGMLLNIMPCVLPVIALKIFGIIRMAGDQPAQVKKLGWFFSLGILASFLVLAGLVVLLKVAGQQVGWGFQFQEPLFVVAMSAVVFAFGLSLFGVFEIRLPGAAVTGVSALASRRQEGGKGYAVSFWEGVFATVLATPCTAPFLGSALGFAFSQPAWIILVIFAAVASGMALPYLILTARPAWMKFLPKPGSWMESAKQFMGFLMMATLLWLLYILGKQLGMEAVVWTGAFLLTVGIACWLIGRFATLTAPRKIVLLSWMLAVASVGIGYVLFVNPILAARDIVSAPVGAATEGGEPNVDGIAWEPFSLSLLESALDQKKSVFIDFTADWCLTCKVNEKAVLADDEVIARIRSSGILAIRADWTSRNQDITRLLAKFGRSGVPLYVFFPAGRPSDPIILPEVITKGVVLDAIQKATAQ